MPKLFNQNYSPAELSAFTGSMEQVAGLRPFEFTDGRVRGLRAVEVWTGSGLRFTVYVDRGLDIGPAEFNGVPLAWVHPALAGPNFYEPQGYGWVRTFGGGLLVTGGLTHFGHPAEDFGLHGRVSHIPAHNVQLRAEWVGDEYELCIEGEVRQAVIFGENLLLKRRIRTRLGATTVVVEDAVSNASARPTEHMMLYHCNFGWPVVSPHSHVRVNVQHTAPRDEAAARGLATFNSFSPPDANFAEQVFFHTPQADERGFNTASIFNPQLNLGAFVRFRVAELPALTQWKMCGAGEYVCALEPCTTHEGERAALREAGRLRVLAPNETVCYVVELGVLNQ